MRHWYDSNNAKLKCLERMLECDLKVSEPEAMRLMSAWGLEQRGNSKAILAVVELRRVAATFDSNSKLRSKLEHIKHGADFRNNMEAFRNNWNSGTASDFMLMDAMDIVMYLEKARGDCNEEN